MAAKKRPPRPNDGQNAKGEGGGFPILPVLGGAVVLIILAAIIFSGSPGQEFGEVEVSGSVLAPYSAQGQDPAVGQVAPEISGLDFQGNEVSVRHDGTPKAIVFLAHWCPHCQNEVPSVQTWLDSTGGVEGVEIVSVSTSMNSAQPNFPPSEWLERENWTQPVIRDDADNSALVAYGAGGFPYWVFVDGDGTVVTRSAGEIPIQSLQQLLSGLVALGAAEGS
jgi:thiol-disulfide isomerase/thioredoxin